MTGVWARLLRALLGAAAAAAWALGVRREVVLSNLRLAFPEQGEAERRVLARAAYRNVARMAADFLLLHRASAAELGRLLVLENEAALEAARAGGRGFIACTAHLGNFELLAAAHSLRGQPVTMISRRMGRSAWNDLWRRARARAGVEDLVVRRGETLRAAREALARGRALGYVIDQNQPRRNAVFPTFFGVPAATAPTPAVLALRTGAPVIFAVTLPLGDGRHRVVYEGPLEVPRTGDRRRDVLAFMQDLNDRLERQVRAHPEHWYWLHRRWKTRPPGPAASPSAAPLDAPPGD